MSGRRYALMVVALLSSIAASAPSPAGAADAGFVIAAPPYVYAPARDYSSPFWYRRWLLTRQMSSGAALYNQPCTMNDGLKEIVVPCQTVAAALDGDFVAGGYVGGAVEAPAVGGYYYSGAPRAWRRHGHARVAFRTAPCR